MTFVLNGDATIEADALLVYVNGELVDSASGSQVWGHSDDIGIGGVAGRTRFHDGTKAGTNRTFGSMATSTNYGSTIVPSIPRRSVGLALIR